MKEFFKENGHYSMIRLLSFISISAAIVVCAVILILSAYAKPIIVNNTFIPADVTVIRELIYLTGTLMVFAFGGKAVQKYAERENNISAGNDGEKQT
jgi:O-antigen/teichoic acid export membrane protein